MRLEGDHKFNALRQQVWDMLMDPEVIAKAIPGCEKFKAVAYIEHPL